MLRSALTIVLLASLCGFPAAAQQRLGPGNPSCYEVRNATAYSVLTHVTTQSRERSVARIESGRSARSCVNGELFPGGQVNFRVVSALGLPLFSCQTKIDRPIVVTATQKSDGGWEYEATCRN